MRQFVVFGRFERLCASDGDGVLPVCRPTSPDREQRLQPARLRAQPRQPRSKSSELMDDRDSSTSATNNLIPTSGPNAPSRA